MNPLPPPLHLPYEDSAVQHILIDDIELPREFEQRAAEDDTGLAESIAHNGLLSPIVVRLVKEGRGDGPARYAVVLGTRRLGLARRLWAQARDLEGGAKRAYQSIPAFVLPVCRTQGIRHALAEHATRVAYSRIQEVVLLQDWVDLLYDDGERTPSHRDLGTRLGVSKDWIGQRLMIAEKLYEIPRSPSLPLPWRENGELDLRAFRHLTLLQLKRIALIDDLQARGLALYESACLDETDAAAVEDMSAGEIAPAARGTISAVEPAAHAETNHLAPKRRAATGEALRRRRQRFDPTDADRNLARLRNGERLDLRLGEPLTSLTDQKSLALLNTLVPAAVVCVERLGAGGQPLALQFGDAFVQVTPRLDELTRDGINAMIEDLIGRWESVQQARVRE